MATVSLDIFSTASLDAAVNELNDLANQIVPFMTDVLAENVALEVGLDIAADVHVYTGRLQQEAMQPFVRIGPGEYELVIDPIDEDTGAHYAQIELNNEAPHPSGTPHNFLRNLDEAAAFSLAKNKEMFKTI